MSFFQLAIDGPVAAGKSSVAKMVAERLNFLYVDTGAMYRAVAWKAQKECIQWVDEASVLELLSTLKLELDKPNSAEEDGRLVTVLVDEKDISGEIRKSIIGEGASIVSAYAGVREVLVAMQQNISAGENVVMEGRDIGTRVLPEANLKIFMDADVEVRVKRKWEFLKDKGENLTLEQVQEDLMKRDDRERNRKVDPLRPAKDSWMLDTSDLPIEAVVEVVVGRVETILQV